MNRSIRVERLFSLGDFKNIKFYDEITDIPEHLALNKEVIDNLYFLQFIQIERSYAAYRAATKQIMDKTVSIEEIDKILEEMRDQKLEELFKIIKNGKEPTIENKLDEEK